MTTLRRRLTPALILVGGLMLAAACGREPALFSEANARAHVGMLAGTIGSRPVGTPANARAREYVIDQLRLYGFTVRVQEADARRPEYGLTARVANVIATLEGSRPEALGLVAHYDSSPHAPGAADDGLGVAVALEAARVLAARPERPYSLMVLLTDAEEAGLMGAAALVTDREVTRRLQAYLQVEATGSAGPALLFETGPGNGWLVSAWAEHAPEPRGASFAADIYRRLPNDTDFSIIKRERIPGLNFAPVGDSYAYHTARDVPDRLTSETLRTTGENIVATALALEATDLTQRSEADPTFFDVAGTVAVHYGPGVGRILTIAALLLAAVAWVRTMSVAIRLEGVLRWLLTVVWTALGTVAAIAAMIGMTWALRAAREVYHPWYAHPRRLFVLLVVAGFLAGWGMTRAGAWLPARARGQRHPLVVWTITLPVWLALACGALWFAPGSAFLVVLPLLVAGLLLAVLPPTSDVALRAASLVIFGIAASLWLRNTISLLDFLVPLFGRFPIVTPVFVFAALLAVSGVMLVPPLVGAFIAVRRLLRPSAATAAALLALAIAAAAAYIAPAYTVERPLRRVVRVLQHDGAQTATWEVASTEPGLDLAQQAPTPWAPSRDDGPWPWTTLPFPFVFRHTGPALPPAPAQVVAPSIAAVPGGLELQLTVVPSAPGLRVSFALPPGLVPVRHNLPGRVRDGAWVASYLAPASDGVLFRASFDSTDQAALQQVRVVVSSERIPDGDGWQSLPPWLPTDRSVWSASASWVLQPRFAPDAPLR